MAAAVVPRLVRCMMNRYLRCTRAGAARDMQIRSRRFALVSYPFATSGDLDVISVIFLFGIGIEAAERSAAANGNPDQSQKSRVTSSESIWSAVKTASILNLKPTVIVHSNRGSIPTSTRHAVRNEILSYCFFPSNRNRRLKACSHML